jgi:hypothetical protein
LKGLGLEDAAESVVETLNEENEALEMLESKLQDLIVASAEPEVSEDAGEEEVGVGSGKLGRAKTSRSRK